MADLKKEVNNGVEKYLSGNNEVFVNFTFGSEVGDGKLPQVVVH